MPNYYNMLHDATPNAIRLLTFLQATVAVLSFSARHFTGTSAPVANASARRSGFYFMGLRYQYPRSELTLCARGGAMARRKKQGKSNNDDKSPVQSDQARSDTIYSLPPLYDLAFGYRNYEDEVDFLIDSHEKYSEVAAADDSPLRIIELAAGPARHSLTALLEYPREEVGSVVALDRSQDMVDYGVENADVELGESGGRRDDFVYVCGDMRKIEESVKKVDSMWFDAAWLLLGSMQHLLTNDDIIACFKSINSILRPGGTVVIELPHPRETFSMGECTRNGWTVPLVDEVDDDGNEKEYGELNIVWGDEDDEFDPVAQIRKFTVGMELVIKNPEDIPEDLDTSPLFRQMTKDGKTTMKEIVPMRLFTLQEIDALARCAGLDLIAKYGALAGDVSIGDEDEAFRMVCVLRKSAS
jgi:SAM-dependent methyltransferase